MFSERGHTILFLGVAVVIALFPYVVTRSIKRQVCPHIKNYHHMNGSEPLPIRINYQIFKVTSNFPSNVQIVQLFCKTGYFLGLNNIAKKNRIVGILNQSSENKHTLVNRISFPSNTALFESQSFGTSILRLRNLVTGRFLAINSNGKVVTQAKVTDESFFKTMYEENYFHTFASHKYFKHRRHDLFLGIKQNGRSKSPKLTYPGQISVQFVLLPNNNTEEKARITSRAKQNRVRQDKRDKG